MTVPMTASSTSAVIRARLTDKGRFVDAGQDELRRCETLSPPSPAMLL
jgi:hypothetical protein